MLVCVHLDSIPAAVRRHDGQHVALHGLDVGGEEEAAQVGVAALCVPLEKQDFLEPCLVAMR